jgi:hypothetical protein
MLYHARGGPGGGAVGHSLAEIAHRDLGLTLAVTSPGLVDGTFEDCLFAPDGTVLLPLAAALWEKLDDAGLTAAAAAEMRTLRAAIGTGG